MCGIIGYLDKAGNSDAPVGNILYRMLMALGCRGPDSAGVAIWGKPHEPCWVLRIKLGEYGDSAEKGRQVYESLRKLVTVRECNVESQYLRAVVEAAEDVSQLAEEVEGLAQGLELVSAGTRLEIVKQVGSPEELEQSCHIRTSQGTHGIGHTRLSTESRVDLSHSQPFWARGQLDIATVHNGHITNYHKLRRQFEQRGVRFHTENDSEVIGVYLHDRLSHGHSLEDALRGSVDDLDGSFCYLAAGGDWLGYVKDSFALKPLVVAETDYFVAIATEEIALRTALTSEFRVFEPGTRQVHLWSTPQYALESR